MNKKLEDKLAMLAFGDLSPEETRLLEQELSGNTEAKLLLEEYRSMRSGLKAMSAVPDHQLSTERLRHAILNQGLKPKPAKSQIGWLWMPAMAAVLTFGIVMVRNLQRTDLPNIGGTMVDLRGSTNAGLGSEPPLPSIVKGPRIENAFALASASGEIMSVDRPAVLARRATVRPSGNDERLEALKDAIRREFRASDSNPSAPMALDRVPPRAPLGRSPKAEEPPIILIDSATDHATGAQRATEVDSVSNVLVGG